MIIHHISKNNIQNIFNYSKSFIHLDFNISKYCIDKIHNDNLKKENPNKFIVENLYYISDYAMHKYNNKYNKYFYKPINKENYTKDNIHDLMVDNKCGIELNMNIKDKKYIDKIFEYMVYLPDNEIIIKNYNNNDYNNLFNFISLNKLNDKIRFI